MAQAQTIEGRIREFVLKSFPLARKHGIKDTEKWLESGLLDSLGTLQLVHFLEGEFSIQISDEELTPDNFESFSIVVDFARRKMPSGTQSKVTGCQ